MNHPSIKQFNKVCVGDCLKFSSCLSSSVCLTLADRCKSCLTIPNIPRKEFTYKWL